MSHELREVRVIVIRPPDGRADPVRILPVGSCPARRRRRREAAAPVERWGVLAAAGWAIHALLWLALAVVGARIGWDLGIHLPLDGPAQVARAAGAMLGAAAGTCVAWIIAASDARVDGEGGQG